MNTSVLIVGAGPVGLTLACELTRYRVPVRIVDKAAASHGQIESHRDLEPHARTSRSRGSRVRAVRRGRIQGRRRQYCCAGRPRCRPCQNGFGGEPIPLRADAAAIGHRAPARGKASAARRLGRASHGSYGAHDRGGRRGGDASPRGRRRRDCPSGLARRMRRRAQHRRAIRLRLPFRARRWAATGSWPTSI